MTASQQDNALQDDGIKKLDLWISHETIKLTKINTQAHCSKRVPNAM